MKKIKQLSLGGLVLAFVLSSCTMDKRVYTTGYHILWNTDVHSDSKQDYVKNTTPDKVKMEHKQVESTVITTKTASTRIEDKSQAIENNYTASTDNSIIMATTPKISWNKKINETAISKNKSTDKSKTITKEKTHTSSEKKSGGTPKGLLYVLCFLMPWLAVGLATDWDVKKVVYNLLWTLLCGIPGIIHAIIIVSKSN